jgi:allantoinase
MGLKRSLDHVMSKPDVRIIRRIDITRYWIDTHPYPGEGLNE